MVIMNSLPPCDLHAYQPPISLWQLVGQHVHDSEKEEVKSMLGNSLVEQSLELQEEVSTLLDIWRDVRAEVNQNAGSSSRLPEPPQMRDMILQEICFFVDNIREKAKKQGIKSEVMLKKHNTEIIDYALEKNNRCPSSRSSSRMSTARSSDGRETPMMISDDDRTSMASTLSEDVESMNDQLNVVKFDEVVQHLRGILQDEVGQLLTDITFLQQCLEDEVDFRDEATKNLQREPTIAELRQERALLEKDLLQPPDMPSHKQLSGMRNLPAPLAGKSNLRPVQKKTPSPPKSSPIKAVHPVASKGDNANTISETGGASQIPVNKYNIQYNQSHLAPKQNKRVVSGRTKVVQLVNVERFPSEDEIRLHSEQIIPVPPSSMKPASARCNSATRFRRMVQDVRESS